MARDLDAELSRNAEAIKRWERRASRAFGALEKLRRQRTRLERKQASQFAAEEMAKAEARERKRKPKKPLPPPPEPSNKKLAAALNESGVFKPFTCTAK